MDTRGQWGHGSRSYPKDERDDYAHQSTSSKKNNNVTYARAKLPKYKIIRGLKPLIESRVQSSGLGTMRGESDLEKKVVTQMSRIQSLRSEQEEILNKMQENSSKLKEIKEKRLELQK